MSAKMLILAVACVAMAPTALAVTATTCNTSCNETGLEVAVNLTIADCRSACIGGPQWVFTLIINFALTFCIGTLISLIVGALLTISGAVVIGLFNLFLIVFCQLITILSSWIQGSLTAPQCKYQCTQWYNQAYSQINGYGGGLFLRGIINIILMIIDKLNVICQQNIQ